MAIQSATYTIVAVVATIFGQPEIAVPAVHLANATGVGSSLASDDPTKNLAIDAAGTLVSKGLIGNASNVFQGLLGDAVTPGLKNAAEGVEIASDAMVTEALKEEAK